MAIDMSQALALVKARLNRLSTDTTLDDYFSARINSVCEELAGTGITLGDGTEDLLLVVDMTVWQYQNRDSQGAMPEWLRLRRRERWLREERST